MNGSGGQLPQSQSELMYLQPQRYPREQETGGGAIALTAIFGSVLLVVALIFLIVIPGFARVAIPAVLTCIGIFVIRKAIGASHRDQQLRRQRATCFPPNLLEWDRPRLVELADAYDSFNRRLRGVRDDLPRRRLATAALCRRHESESPRKVEPGPAAVSIVTSPAWSSPWLRDHRLDIDPLREATEIYRYLDRVAAKVIEFQDKAQQFRGTSVADTYWAYIQDLTADLTAVRRRGEALVSYGRQIERLSGLMRVEQLRPQLEYDADSVRDLVSESRRHELATEHLQRQQTELQQIESGLREIRSLLFDNLELRLPMDGHGR